MKKTLVFLLINLIHTLIAAESLPGAPDDPEKITHKLPAVAYDHLAFLHKRIPPLSDEKLITKSLALIARIDTLYGANIKANPAFSLLIKPLIIIERDETGYHMSFVMSDLRISYLQLYAEKINPPVFSYDEALALIARPNGKKLYDIYMNDLTSIPQMQVDFARFIWNRLQNISAAQLAILDEVLGFLNLDQNLKLMHVRTVFERMLLKNNWDASYWKRYIESIEKKDFIVDSILSLSSR